MWRVLSWQVGVVEPRSEEQGVEAGALPRSLPLGSQSCLFCVSRTHPVWGRNCGFGPDRAVCDGLGYHPSGGFSGDAESGGWLRGVGEIGA